jgi:cytochrome c oxidase assembly protein subunit 15
MKAGASALISLMVLQILLGAQIIWTMRRPEMTTGHVVTGALTLATTFWITWFAHRDVVETQWHGRAAPDFGTPGGTPVPPSRA